MHLEPGWVDGKLTKPEMEAAEATEAVRATKEALTKSIIENGVVFKVEL